MKNTEYFQKLADRLFESVKNLPVIDWHNHLSIQDIAQNRIYEDPAALWLLPDPYKHRVMRICGIPEQQITGNASPYEKFCAWCKTLPQLAGNPLYDWSLLELERVFGITVKPGLETAQTIWKEMSERLKEPDFSALGLLKRFRVEYAAPCVSIKDTLSAFPQVPGIVPSFRGDDLTAIDGLSLLERQTGIAIISPESLKTACRKWVAMLHDRGCRFADHALDAGFSWQVSDGNEEKRIRHYCAGTLSEDERSMFRCDILRVLAEEYARLGWTMQLHIGALRQTSSRLLRIAGPAGGFAGIAHACDVESIVRMLDEMECSEYGLPKVLLYTLNPVDHAALAVLSGSFPGDGVRGKVQLGPAWWFCDNAHGMRDCFESLAAYGVLSVFPGMTTDSRSFLSFVRHEYFRRIFCRWLAEKARLGDLPDEEALLMDIAEKVCYKNAHERITE